MADHHCDYLVIGAGAAGSVVAGRLARNESCRVTLVEAGGDDRSLLTTVPGIGFLASISKARNWNFETEPVPGLGGRRMRWNQGRVLGGSSTINGMLYMRGHSLEYDRWHEKGCVGWSFEEVLPYYLRAESSTRGASQWHGTEGPFATRPSNTPLPICQAFLDAAREAGFPVVDDLNANIVEGFGRFDINVRRGRRVSAAKAYVSPVRKQPNFKLLLESLALRLLFRGDRAVGAEIARAGRRETIEVGCEIVLCGGAINSPQLLMLSGIGPAGHLREYGIEVITNSPDVGQQLSNHPAYQLRYTCSAPVTAYGYRRPHVAAAMALQYALMGAGPLGESYVAQGGVFRSDRSLNMSDSIAVMAPALVTRGGAGASVSDLLPSAHGFRVSVSVGRQKSRGEIRLRSADPLAAPIIQPNFLDAPEDMTTLRNAVSTMREIMRQPSISSLIESELQPGDVDNSSEGLETEIRNNAGTYSHPMGSCRMGGDVRSVVDPELRVRGVEGLRVADASIIPEPLNACTHGPSIMIGEKAAALLGGM